jgi:hypothetical protein
MTKLTTSDTDGSKDAKPLMDALCDLKCKYNLTLILIEHTRKVNERCRATQAGRNDVKPAKNALVPTADTQPSFFTLIRIRGSRCQVNTASATG